MTNLCKPSLVLLGWLWSIFVFAAPFPALVDGEWLSLHNNKVVVLDIRSRAEYLEEHWPDARWAGFNELGWQVKRYGIPGYLPTEENLSKLLASLGLDGSESVVVIGSASQMKRIAEATRIVWSLMMAGLNNVALLDGGIESIARHKLTTKETLIRPTKFIINYQHGLLADSSRVQGSLDDNGIVIDFRPRPFFEGYQRDPQVSMGGTILEALGLPAESLFDQSRKYFLSAQKIKQQFDYYDIPNKGPIITFGDTGVWGALGWFVLHQILANQKTRLYDGSMVEWIDWGGEVHDSTDDMGGPIG